MFLRRPLQAGSLPTYRSETQRPHSGPPCPFLQHDLHAGAAAFRTPLGHELQQVPSFPRARGIAIVHEHVKPEAVVPGELHRDPVRFPKRRFSSGPTVGPLARFTPPHPPSLQKPGLDCRECARRTFPTFGQGPYNARFRIYLHKNFTSEPYPSGKIFQIHYKICFKYLYSNYLSAFNPALPRFDNGPCIGYNVNVTSQRRTLWQGIS